jgi:hypothetical protein
MRPRSDPIAAWGDVSARAARSSAVRAPAIGRGRRPAAAAGLGVLTLGVIVVAAALVLRPSAGPAADRPVTASVDDGMFRIELTTPRATYTTVDEITPVARLIYLGPDATRTVSHATHPIGFRVEEIGGARTMPGGTRLPCVSTVLTRDVPIEQPFSKSGSPTDDPAVGFDQRWYEDPVLRLPAGRWRITALLAVVIDGCSGERHELAVSNDITVTPAALGTEPVVAHADDGTFRVELTTPHGLYGRDDPIAPLATVTYLGTADEISMYHAMSPIFFTIDEVGGDRVMSGAMGAPCIHTAIRRDTPLAYPFVKSGIIGPSFDAAWFADPVLRLPVGTWRIRAAFSVETTDGNDTCGGVAHLIDLDNVVRVVDGSAAISPPRIEPSSTPSPAVPTPPSVEPSVEPSLPSPSDGPVTADDEDGLFRLELTTPSGRYRTDEPISPSAALTYLGPDANLTFGHADPAVFFTIEEVGGGRQMTGGADDVCSHTTLERGVPVLIPFQKGGQIGLGFEMDWFADPVLRLPAGTWRIGVRLEAAIPDCGQDIRELRAENVITVVRAP